MLRKDGLKNLNAYTERVMFFDPTEIYSRIHERLDPYERLQSVDIGRIFPKNEDKTCGCGCGEKLTGRRTRWATDDCSGFVGAVTRILCGHADVIRFYVDTYYGSGCANNCILDTELDKTIELDHIVGIKHGGGRSWLSNYTNLCKKCHREKTNKDFGWKTPKPKINNQLNMF